MNEEHQKFLDEFDFHTVRRIMKLMNWTWWNSIDGDVPTVGQMRECVIALFHDAVSEMRHTGELAVLSSAGFEVTVYPDESFDVRFVPVELLSY